MTQLHSPGDCTSSHTLTVLSDDLGEQTRAGGGGGGENYFFLNTLGENKNSPVVLVPLGTKLAEHFPVFSEGS